MLQLLRYPAEEQISELIKRPSQDLREQLRNVQPIMKKVRESGDEALKMFSKQFDGVEIGHWRVNQEDIDNADQHISQPLKDAIQQAASNVKTFHERQLIDEGRVEIMAGVNCWRKAVPIDRVGLYVPGGTAPLFSTVLMLGIPATLAGCDEVVMCTPPGENGQIHPAILYTAGLCGIDKIYRVGGAQAIAALSYGTESVPKVDKIFGPGNSYVTAAKQLAQLEGIAIDMAAGPSEVAVIADDSANPAFVASDLLAQAEHGPDSHVLLLSDSETMLQDVLAEIERQLADLPRQDIAKQALTHSRAILFNDLAEAFRFSNAYAPEHLIVQVAETEHWTPHIRNAGSVFLGHYTPEALGDYASGTNHTLPTGGTAKAMAGVSLDSFLKKITFQQADTLGLTNLSKAVTTMAEAEGLAAHRYSVDVRTQSIRDD